MKNTTLFTAAFYLWRVCFYDGQNREGYSGHQLTQEQGWKKNLA